MSPMERPTRLHRLRERWGSLDDGWRATMLGWSIVAAVYLQQLL